MRILTRACQRDEYQQRRSHQFRRPFPRAVGTLGPSAQSTLPNEWSTPIYSASTYGVGEDNPTNAYSLTEQQAGRALQRQHIQRKLLRTVQQTLHPRRHQEA